jgi:Skp family chaperone for outer membrane proteins
VDRKKEQGDRLQVLLELCTNRERQYQDLRAKPERTAEEDGTFKTLDEIGTMRDADLNKRIDALEEELGVRTARVRADLMVPVRSVVNTIAAERGFLVVLEKDWVYFGGEDITEDVVKRLNETVAPPTAGAQPAGGGEKPKEGDGAKPGEGGGQQP